VGHSSPEISDTYNDSETEENNFCQHHYRKNCLKCDIRILISRIEKKWVSFYDITTDVFKTHFYSPVN